MKRAFTLIELMVVIGIIVVLVAVTIPGINAMTKGNDAAQAQNALSSLIASARSRAISSGHITALILYEENSGNAPQTSATFAVEDTNAVPPAPTLTNPNPLLLQPLGENQVIRLPLGAMIAGIDSTGVLAVTTGAARAPRFVLFDNQGQMVLRAGIELSNRTPGPLPTDISASTYKTLQSWQTDFGTMPAATGWTATPGFVVYSRDEFTRANPPGTSAANINKWLMENTKVIAINVYTGSVIQ